MENTEIKTTNAFDAFLARAHTRNGFLKAIAAAGIGAAAGSTLLTKDAEAQAALSDVELLNFALTIEYFESEVFYPAVLDAGILSGEALAVVQQLAAVEAVHRDTLIAGIQALGGTPIPRPQYTIPPGILASQQAFLEAALQQEIVDVGANLGIGPLIQNPDILAAAGAISGQEGENVTAFRNLLGVVPPANEAFPAALTQEQVLAALAPFLGAGGGGGQLPKTGGPGA